MIYYYRGVLLTTHTASVQKIVTVQVYVKITEPSNLFHDKKSVHLRKVDMFR